jgi:hypothetical protein
MLSMIATRNFFEIGQCNAVFRPDHGGPPDILTAKSRIDFFMAKKNILLQYNRYVKTGAPRLTIPIDVEIVPDPRKYANSNKPMTSQRKILVKEQILEHEFITNNLNIFKCNVCLECHVQSNVLPDQESYTCKKCCKRKDNDYYLNNNLHPVWFGVNKDGSHKLDEGGKKIPHFEIPLELKRLTVAKQLQLLYPLFIFPMAPLHLKVIVLHFHKIFPKYAMSCHTEKSNYLCLYITLVIRTHLHSTQSLCESTNEILSMHSFG